MFGDGHEPLIRKGGVYFVKAQTVNEVEDMTRDKSQERCVRADGSENHAYEFTGGRIHVYKLTDCRIHVYKLTD